MILNCGENNLAKIPEVLRSAGIYWLFVMSVSFTPNELHDLLLITLMTVPLIAVMYLAYLITYSTYLNFSIYGSTN
jgi:hypothetical protein